MIEAISFSLATDFVHVHVCICVHDKDTENTFVSFDILNQTFQIEMRSAVEVATFM